MVSAAHEGTEQVFSKMKEILRERPQAVIYDLGCGRGFWGKQIKLRFQSVKLIGVEVWEPYVGEARSGYDEIVIDDIRKFLPSAEKADIILMMDVIEHFERSEGLRLIDLSKKKADHIFISTPIVPYPQGPIDGNPYEVHRDSWKPEELEALGFKTLYLGKVVGVFYWRESE